MIIALFICSAFIACEGSNSTDDVCKQKTLRPATTTSTVQSGLSEVLIPAFEAKAHIKTIVLDKGTGVSLKFAAEGKADVVLVHAREAEDKFIVEGYGVNRRDVMYNNFVVLGPTDDPAGIKGENNVIEAFRKIADSKSPFVSRGDNSGTYIREQDLWKLVGVTPEGEWYQSIGGGMLKALEEASALKA